MTPEEPSENPFSVTPEDRRHAEELVSERMKGVEREHRLLGRIRSHVHGGTPIGEVFTDFTKHLVSRDAEHGIMGLPLQGDESSKNALIDFLTVQDVLFDFFANGKRFEDARDQGSLLALIERETWHWQAASDYLPPPQVVIKLHNAIDAELAAEKGQLAHPFPLPCSD